MFPLERAFERFTISPATNWARFFNPQFFVSYNAGDAEVENHVLARVGSYGQQLARIIDVLDAVVARLPLDGLTPAERTSVERFRDLSRRAEAAVSDFRGSSRPALSLDAVDRLVADLVELERTDPTAHRALVERLRKALS